MSRMHRRQVLQALAALGVGCFGRVRGAAPPRFEIRNDRFWLDGRPLQIRSGEMHYPRVPRERWRARMRQIRALGLNTLSTYAFWSQHEPSPGHWDFSGQNDLRAYLAMAAEEGLYTILRPGPYVCAEVDYGGLPAWLLGTPGLRARSFDPRFLAAARGYLERVAAQVADLSIEHGGSLLMVQFENEYGSFGQDRDYLGALLALYENAGFGRPLYTADGGEEGLFEGGTLPGVPAVVNFGGDVAEAAASFAALAAFRPDGPRMAGEYWAGWFDHWGETHHRQPSGEAAATVNWMMARGHSFNLYMVHGGTSFGWLPGANASSTEPYQPDTTSYDYDAPIDEAGRVTDKYRELRAVMARHLPVTEALPPVPADEPTRAVPSFRLEPVADLAQMLGRWGSPVGDHRPHPMERYGQSYGYILYRTHPSTAFNGVLSLGDVRDEALVLLDGKPVGAVSRRLGPKTVDCEWQPGQTLDILVENTGRIGFGSRFVEERKGLVTDVRAGDEPLYGWTVYPLPLTAAEWLADAPVIAPPSGPAFWRGRFTLERTDGTFLDMRGWGRGHLWVNGHHLGRFWDLGPQHSLWVPGDWLRRGFNEVLLFSVQAGSAQTLFGLIDPVYATPGVAGAARA
jgi:beta-galactosidase